MRLLHLIAGAGGMYCGSCLSGNTLAGALGRLGDDVTLLPLYTPLRTDERNHSVQHVEMGGINVYLNERWPWLRLPRWLASWLNGPWLLRWAAGRAGGTRPEQLGALCVSMLRGEDGRQRGEIEQLLEWVVAHAPPQLVQLNNALLAALAGPLKRRLGVPVVCWLSGEDVFLEKLPEPYRTEAKTLVGERLADCAGLAAMNLYYADFAAAYFGVPRARIAVVEPGIDLADFAPREEPPARETKPGVTIGYLARICADKGLHNLVEAAGRLAPRGDLPSWRVVAAGYLDMAEKPYLAQCEARARALGIADRFEYVGQLDRPGKAALLASCDVFCLPTDYRESKGLSVLEAWAAGAAAVLPAHGVFPELIDRSGGGMLYPPGDADALADALAAMMLDDALRVQRGRHGRAAVEAYFSAPAMARRTRAWYDSVLA